jgi:hypothetical protein
VGCAISARSYSALQAAVSCGDGQTNEQRTNEAFRFSFLVSGERHHDVRTQDR